MIDRFSEPLILHPSRTKWILFLAGSVTFVAVEVWLLATQRDNSAITWFGVFGFAAASIVFATNLIPGSSSLTLDMDGFKIKQFYKVRRTPWQNVTNIHAGNIPPSILKTVRYNDSGLSVRKLARLGTAALGYNAILPDTYGMTADELAVLMTKWRERSLASN
jgi:hypothetical protein